MKIQSDNRDVEKLLRHMEKIIVANGGSFHDQLSIHCENGMLWVTLSADIDLDKVIMKVPDILRVPVKPLNVSLKENTFHCDPDPDELSAEQIELGRLMLELYTITGKAEQFCEESPWIKFHEAPELLERMLEARSGKPNFENNIARLEEGEPADDYICERFLNSRVCGFKSEEETRIQTLLPMIDFLNHDFRGCPLNSNRVANHAMNILPCQPYKPNPECFAFYGVYDVLDMFMNYAHLDEKTPIVRATPQTIPVEGAGNLIVNSFAGVKQRQQLPQAFRDLGRYMPMMRKDDRGNSVLSNLIISIKWKPHAFRRVLYGVLWTHLGESAKHEKVVPLIYSIEKEVIENTTKFYVGLQDSLTEFSTAPARLVKQVHNLATVQLSKLNDYQYKDDYFDGGA